MSSSQAPQELQQPSTVYPQQSYPPQQPYSPQSYSPQQSYAPQTYQPPTEAPSESTSNVCAEVFVSLVILIILTVFYYFAKVAIRDLFK